MKEQQHTKVQQCRVKKKPIMNEWMQKIHFELQSFSESSEAGQYTVLLKSSKKNLQTLFVIKTAPKFLASSFWALINLDSSTHKIKEMNL